MTYDIYRQLCINHYPARLFSSDIVHPCSSCGFPNWLWLRLQCIQLSHWQFFRRWSSDRQLLDLGSAANLTQSAADWNIILTVYMSPTFTKYWRFGWTQTNSGAWPYQSATNWQTNILGCTVSIISTWMWKKQRVAPNKRPDPKLHGLPKWAHSKLFVVCMHVTTIGVPNLLLWVWKGDLFPSNSSFKFLACSDLRAGLL